MDRLLTRILGASLALWVGVGRAQYGGWSPNQVNATLCQWEEPRVGVIRDTVYIDGGYLSWERGYTNGEIGPPDIDSNPGGLVFLLNFSTPFKTSQNLSQVFTSISKAPNGGAANNFAQNFYDGGMFANDDEWYTYGGLVRQTAAFSPPASDNTEGYEQFWYGAPGKAFAPGFISGTLGNVTRYVTGGGGVSVPSENKGFYFSGLKSQSSGEIVDTGSGNDSTLANVPSSTLISIDMSIQRSEVWSNKTLPSNVPGRANPELVWIPQGEQGLLVAIGGVINPIYAVVNLSLSDAQMAQSQSISPTFMSTVSIYDIANDTWYTQETSGTTPPALTQGCTVVASTNDGSSHNIYWYGGYDGIDFVTPLSDDVYILSIPSFTWVKSYSGTETHGRAGHKCVKPYPDQMFVIGGITQSSGPNCVEGGIIQILNLSTSTWINSYDPTVWSNYSVPSLLTAKIGGTASGGATTVSPSKWSSDALASLFASSSSYDVSKIKNWYPYTAQNTTNTTNPRVPDIITASKSSVPSWVPPVVGVVVGLVLLSALVVIFLLWRRRKYLRSNPDAMTNTTDQNRNRIASWLYGAPGAGDPKSPTATSDGSPDAEFASGDRTGTVSRLGSSRHVAGYEGAVEAGGTQVHEMMDTSRPQEMSATEPASGTGFSFLAASALHKGQKQRWKNKPSRTTSQTSESTVSDGSSAFMTPTTPGRPDSPSLGSGIAGAGEVVDAYKRGHATQGSEVSSASGSGAIDSRIVSGVSASSLDRGNLGRFSGSPSGIDDGLSNPHGVAILPEGKISPPTPRIGGEGRDYISHASSGSVGAVSPEAVSPGTPGSAASPSTPSTPGTPGSLGSRRNRVSGGGRRMSHFGEDL